MNESPTRMPTYMICWPDRPETIEAESPTLEGNHQVLRGTALVIGRPREAVLRRVPRHVFIEEIPPPVLQA